MSDTIASERCLEFVRSQSMLPSKDDPVTGQEKRQAITISREAGAGAHAVADELLKVLDVQRSNAMPWKVFDRDLVEKVLEEHDLPERMAQFMPEDRMSALADSIDELFGLHPSTWALVRKTAETILGLAELGNAIIIGRGGNIITQDLEGVVHVRLVGSMQHRIRHAMEYHGLAREAATEYVEERDLGRRRYVKHYYSADIDDPLLYDMVLNTDRLGYAGAARLIANALGAERARSRRASSVARGGIEREAVASR
jgi:cytidylate kinase